MKRTTNDGYPLVEAIDSPNSDRPRTSSFLNHRYFKLERHLTYPETGDPELWQRGRRNLRRALRSTLRFGELGSVSTPVPQVLEERDMDGYRRLNIAYQTLPWVRLGQEKT